MANGRLTDRNSAIAEMLSDGEQLKNFYRFIAQNPHINLHDACQIVIERPNATVCYTFSEWAAMDRRVTKGRKGIVYYDNDGYKHFVFDANDTHGDNRYSRPILPMKRLLDGLDKLNGTEYASDERSDYRKIHKGVQLYLQEQGELTADDERNRHLIDGITFSLYSKTGFPKSAGIRIDGLPYSYAENAEFVKDVYILADNLTQDIEEANSEQKEEITVIDDTEEETLSDEPVLPNPFAEQVNEQKGRTDDYSERQPIKQTGSAMVFIQSAVVSNYRKDDEQYDVFYKSLVSDENPLKKGIYLGKRYNYDNKGGYDNSDNSLIFLSENDRLYGLFYGEGFIYSQQKFIDSGVFTDADYKEFYEIQTGILKDFEITQAIFFDGAPFRYPDWNKTELTKQSEPKHPAYPMYKRYMELQATKPNVIVLYRLGDFYEAFDESARQLSAELDLTLTGRDVGLKERIPMCGIPYHALDGYLDKILLHHGVLLSDGEDEPKYILPYAEALGQSAEDEKEQTKSTLTEIDSNEPTPFDDEQSETDDEWRNELAEELTDSDEQEEAEISDTQDDETDYDEVESADEFDEMDDETEADEEADSSADEQEIKQPKDKVKSTPKKHENGIKDRKRRNKPQLTLFDYLTEPQEKSPEEALIERQLKYGSGVEHGKFRIFDKYQENPTAKTFAEFLKKEYGWGGHGGWNGDDEMHDAKGIEMKVLGAHGETLVHVKLKWPEVANRIADLIDDGKYFSEQEIKQYDAYKVEQNRQQALRAEESRQKSLFLERIVLDEPTDRKERIKAAYYELDDDKAFVKYLKGEYGERTTKELDGKSIVINDFGIYVSKNESAIITQDRYFTEWEIVAEKISTLINKDRYLKPVPQGEQFSDLDAEEDDDWDRFIDERILKPVEAKTDANRIKELAVYMVNQGTEKSAEGTYYFYFHELPEDRDFIYAHAEEIRDELETHAEIIDVEAIGDTGGDFFSINYDLKYCQNLDEEVKRDYFGDNTDLNGVLDQSELGGAKTRFRNNVAAIKLVNKLYAENRNPTDEEKKVLSRFVGWGGLSQAFDENNPQWKKEYSELKMLLSQEDYEQARSSTLNAYYTAKDVIGGIYSALNRFGVKGNNRILEPSMGTGNFFGYMPQDIADGARLYGVELDNLTGRIAAKLYPQANVQIKGFEETSFPNDKFDIVVGNVPFGGYGVADSNYNRYNFKVHDYFLAKSLDKVKPNGIVAIVTSKGTMDKLNPSARKYVAERAELLGAIRLPNTAFKQTAGTEAVADILFFRKRTERLNVDAENIEWLGTGKTAEGYEINNYFVNHPEMILGTLAEETGLYGGVDVTVKPDGRELSVALSEAIKNLPQGFYTNPEHSPVDEEKEVDYNVKPMCYKAESGRLFMRVGDEMVEQRIPSFPKDAYQRIQGMIALREELHHILDLQIQGCSDEVLQDEQRKLNEMYDAFVGKYGNLNGQTNARLFKEDGDSALLFACEEIDKETEQVKKSDIFFKRTIRPYVVPTSTDDPFEALQISKNERGRVDIAYIEELTGKSYDDVLFELGEAVFRDPESTDLADKYSGFVTSEEYLSGKVVAKLNIARRYAEAHPEFQDNVTALERVQPTPLTASEISVRLGQTWIDKDYYKQFYCELIGLYRWRYSDVALFYNPHDSSWRLDQKESVRRDTEMKQKEVFGTRRAPAYRLFIDCMNMRSTTIYDTITDEHGNDVRVLNQAETIEAREKQNKIKEAFANWIFAKPERRDELEATYNRLFNQIRLPSYDGSYLKFPEMNPAIELNPHQKNAVHRIITSNDSTLLHHVVGSGKTYTMITSVMKMRQLGLCKKAMVAVPNHLVQQWANEWRKLYPNAKILVATKEDLEKDNRQKFVSKVALGDWDGIIIAQSSFAKIPVSIDRQIKKLNEEIKNIELTIAAQWAENGMPRGAVKNLELIKKNKKKQLKKLMDGNKKDDVLTFENLGVDYLYIDEAHYYKNLFFYTKMNNVAGISNAASQRASDLKLKCEYLQELHGSDRGVVFATGTPISNSMTEMYTMQSYLQPSTLKEAGIEFFDGWAANFGETVTSMELAPSGKGYQAKTRFAKFTNLPELQTLYRSFADVITSDMVKLDVPEYEKHVINLKPSDTIIELAEKIVERAERIHNEKIDPSIDNMLKITSDGKKLALDPRCFVPDSDDEEGSKLNEVVHRVYEIWEDTTTDKSAQVVFCDMSTPKVKSDEYIYGLRFDAYNDIKYKLVKKGIPANEIAFIHDAQTDEQKQSLFDKVNSGTIRVLIGSTEKCGAGANIQKRLLVLHHLDTPYRPSDMEQREGRIIRQGNTNKKVDIYVYIMERTFDSYSYQILEIKDKFIKQITNGEFTAREFEDVDITSLNYGEIKAIATGNPRIKRKMEVDAEVSRLRVLEGQHKKNIYALQDKIRRDFPENIRKQELLLERIELDLMHLESSKPTDPEAFKISVNGKVYTDRKEGGKALTDALYSSKPETVIAEYCGFKISMNPMTSLSGERDITVSANGQYTVTVGESASGNLTRIENFFEDLPKRKERIENRLKQLKEDLAIAEEQVEKPFDNKSKLEELLKEQSELNAELNLDKRESVIIDDGDSSGDDNYKAIPVQKYHKEDDIIDKEDKVAAMKVDVLPDYSVTQEDMHKYGYTWDGMLPITKNKALNLWTMGLTICKLGKNDDHIEVDDYADFDDDGNTMYGIEKPVWNKFLNNEKSLPYFFARSQFAEAARIVTSDDMSAIDEKFTITFINNNHKERSDLDDFLADRPKPDSEYMKPHTSSLLYEFADRIWCDSLKYYGWVEDDVQKSIVEHLEDTELKTEAKYLIQVPFNAEKELMSRLAELSEQEIEDMRLPVFDDELTLVSKEPSIYLDDSEKTYLPGLLAFRNDITGNYYVMNNTSVKGLNGKELELGDKTNVKTALAYDGLYNGNPLREFHSENEAKSYYLDKLKAIRSVIAESADYRRAVISSVQLEYDELEDKLLNSSTKTVYNNNFKIHCFNEFAAAIVDEDEEGYLEDDDYKALYEDRGHILDQLYNDYAFEDRYKLENLDDNIDFIHNYCKAHHIDVYNKKPVYLDTFEYADEHNEVQKFRESHEISESCKNELDEAIRRNFDGMHLNGGFENELINKYGIERVSYIVATTINEHEYDGRYSHANKEWAKTIPMSESESERSSCCLNIHPAILDGFTDRLRMNIKEDSEGKNTEEMPQELKSFIESGDSRRPVYYTFIYEMLGGGKFQYQAYLLNYGEDEIYPFFDKGFATQEELEREWNKCIDNEIYSSVDFHRCEPYEQLRMSNQNNKIKEEEKSKLAQDKYKNFTARGDKVLSIVKDRDDRNIAIIQREKLGDFVVAAGYDTTDGTWKAGKYDLPTLEAAEQYRTEKYGFENTSDTSDRKWLTCKVSPEALIKKYQYNSRFKMPTGSGYEGYAYSVFNDRIKEGTITTDLKSDTRERALVIRIPTDSKVELRKGEDSVELEPHDFISLVNETASDKYEREQRYIAVFPPEAIIKEYDTSMLLAMPNDTKYKGYVYYLPTSVVNENKDRDDGSLIANIGESFKVTLRKGEEKIELTAKEYSELVGGKKAEQYKREPTELDKYREQSGEDDKKWNTVAISESAVIANYKDTTLFKMPQGNYSGFVYYIPSGMVRKEDDGLYLRVPEDFVAHLKNGEEKKDLTAQEFIAAIDSKTDDDYKSIFRKPSEEAIKQFEKVESQLRRNVPVEMLNKPNWVVVRTRENNDTGRLDKFLINPHTGKFAESDNPETWSDFDTACKYAKDNGGVCLAYALEWDSDIACIDLDGCMEKNGDFSEIAQRTFKAADGSYCERSVSGKGLHIFGKTKGADLRSFSKDKTMEYYQGGHFIAMTGDFYGSSQLKSFDTPMMQSVLESKLEKRTEWKNTGAGIEGLSSMDDREMLEKAFAAKNGDNVKKLYNGVDLQNNHSNSDMSLMNYLAFWSNHDIDQMLRVFSTSGLYRPDKPQSYYEHTAIKAVKGTPVYTPPKASNNKPSGNGNGSGKDGK